MRSCINPSEWGDWFDRKPATKEQAKRLKIVTVLTLEYLRLQSLHGAKDFKAITAKEKAMVAELQYEHGGAI